MSNISVDRTIEQEVVFIFQDIWTFGMRKRKKEKEKKRQGEEKKTRRERKRRQKVEMKIRQGASGRHHGGWQTQMILPVGIIVEFRVTEGNLDT